MRSAVIIRPNYARRVHHNRIETVLYAVKHRLSCFGLCFSVIAFNKIRIKMADLSYRLSAGFSGIACTELT
jgi:hypothetical protein